MSAIRSILAHLDGGRHATARLQCARVLAQHCQARLQVLHAAQPPVLGALPLPAATEDTARREARHLFDGLAAAPGWPMEWLAPGVAPAVAGFSHQALHADLMLLGQRDPYDRQAFDVPSDFVEQVLANSGAPALIVPYRGVPQQRAFDPAGCMLVAWAPVRGAARALAAALPLLAGAREVHVASWCTDAEQAHQEHETLAARLALHGVTAVQRHRRPMDTDLGGAILALASDVGADLLVMGCYGHGRMRELLFGGASITVLREARLPVLTAY